MRVFHWQGQGLEAIRMTDTPLSSFLGLPCCMLSAIRRVTAPAPSVDVGANDGHESVMVLVNIRSQP